MARGYPDWQSVPQTSLTTIKTFLQGVGGPISIWTPAAGKRIRLMAYHLSIDFPAHGGAGGGTASLQVFLQEAAPGQVLDRWDFNVVIGANAQVNPLLDSGLSVLPGGGWPVGAINRALQLLITGAVTGTAVIDVAQAGGMVAGLEE
jgi:hypothetical protein